MPEDLLLYNPTDATTNYIHVPQEVTLGKRKPTSAEDICAAITERESIMMNFVPQMLTALVMDMAISVVNYCRLQRMKDARTFTKWLRLGAESYTEAVATYYGTERGAVYLDYVNAYRDEVEGDLYKMELNLDTLAKRQGISPEDTYLPVTLAQIDLICGYVATFDKHCDELLGKRIEGYIAADHKCPQMEVVQQSASMFAEKRALKIALDEAAGKWASVLANRALMLADRLYRTENQMGKNEA